MKFLDDGPIFIKQKVNFLPPDKILHLVVNNNIIVIAMANNLLLRIDMKHPDSPEGISFLMNHNIKHKIYVICFFPEIDISKYAMNMEMSRMFLDPLGNHLLISLVPKSQDPPNPPPELFYLHRKTTKLKQVNMMNKYN